MNSRALRRLAQDHGALHSEGLPPNYLFDTSSPPTDVLTELDILLAGPTHTPFARGVWKLHLTIPPTYPHQPPTANFRTPIFHPNVDPQTGGVCVETLKRDWDNKLTLRDVLVTISCLLIQPNPDSALNADAGALIQEGYEAFAKRAQLMTSIHAAIPKRLQAAVSEAQKRGQEEHQEEGEGEGDNQDTQAAPRRRTIARVRAQRRQETSPSGAPATRRHQNPQGNSFVFRAGDVFQSDRSRLLVDTNSQADEDRSSTADGEQENEVAVAVTHLPPKSSSSVLAATPRRPGGVAVPLGELILDPPEEQDTSEDMDMEPEYPPSPRKSPSKSPPKRRQFHALGDQAESSRDASLRAPNITPPNLFDKPLAGDSPYIDTSFELLQSSMNTRRGLFQTPPKRAGGKVLFGSIRESIRPSTPRPSNLRGIVKCKSPFSAERRHDCDQRIAGLDAELWMLCGNDIKRWNRGDFDGEPFRRRAGRW